MLEAGSVIRAARASQQEVRKRAPRGTPASKTCLIPQFSRQPLGGASFSITWSRLKLAAFWRGGYSWNVARKLPT